MKRDKVYCSMCRWFQDNKNFYPDECVSPYNIKFKSTYKGKHSYKKIMPSIRNMFNHCKLYESKEIK